MSVTITKTFLIKCDRRGCDVTAWPASSLRDYRRSLKRAGWYSAAGVDYCPKHWPRS